jgi:biopolymer transport protein ExbD
MIVRPLELASRLRPEPRSLDWMFFVNAGLLVLFFSLFGSRFVLAPGLKVEVSAMPGARAGATTTTHYVSVSRAGLIFNDEGPVTMAQLKEWLRKEARKTKTPALLVRANVDVRARELAEISSAAAAEGFRVVWSAEEPPAAK